MRRTRITIAVLAIALALGACSSAPRAATDEPSSVGGAERVLSVLLADDWAFSSAVTDAVQSFEQAHPDVRVDLRGLPFPQIEEAVTADLQGQRDLDVVQWHAFAAAAQGEALPVTDAFRSAYPDGTFVPGAVQDVSWGGQVYGLPLDVNALVLLVNETLLARLGFTVDDLATFEDVRAVAEATEAVEPKLTAVANSTWGAHGWIRANGGEVLEVDADGARLTLDTPHVVGAMNFLAELTRDERWAFHPFANDVSVDGFTVFREGLTVLHPTGTWDTIRLALDEPDFDWRVVPMPVGPMGPPEGGTTLGGSSLFFPPGVDDLELAFAFAQHLISPEFALRYAREEGRLPARLDVLEDPFFGAPALAPAVSALAVAQPMRLIASADANEVFAGMLTEVVNGRVDDAAPLLREAQKRGAPHVAELEPGS